MKTFKDLEFKKHPSSFGFDKQAVLNFDNNYGVSVITGSSAYTSHDKPFEVAIMYNEELCYSTHITDDVLGYQSADDVNRILFEVQNLKE